MRITKLFPARRTAVLMLLVLASSMTIAAIAGVSGRMMIVDNIVANNVAATPYLYDSDILTGVAVEKPWYPSLEIGANGHGYMIWAEVPTIASQNHTLRFRSTNNLITDLGARHNWSSAPSLPNVNQNYTRGFVVGAPSKNGTLNVFFLELNRTSRGFRE